jgi:2-methylisocitrate lyase-like PEP mutase family enzyme
VKAVAPKPVNLLVHGNWITVAQAAEWGVRRISIGGALARKTWNALTTAAQEIAEHGTFSSMAWTGAPVDLNGLFR